MSFAKTFEELRRRRRLSYTEWKPEIPPPYVSDVEKKGLLPSEGKLEHLASVFVEVAREQGAVDPEEDARILYRERDRSYFVERAHVEPDIADVIVSLRELVRDSDLKTEQRGEAMDTLQRAAEAMGDLDPEEREQFLETLDRTISDFGNGNGDHEAAAEAGRAAAR